MGFASVAFAAYLVENGTEVKDIAILFATVAYLGHSSGFGVLLLTLYLSRDLAHVDNGCCLLKPVWL